MAATTRAIAFASRWFDENIYRRTFEPLIADWQREWHDAPRHLRARVSLKGWWTFICAAVLLTPRVIATSVPREVTDDIARRVTRYAAIGAALLMIPTVVELGGLWLRGSTWAGPALILFSIPGAIIMAFPFAMGAAVDVIRRRRQLLPHVERAVAVKLGILAAAFMLIGGGWVVPASNQAARDAINPPGMDAPLRTMRELSTLELAIDPARANVFAPGTNLAARSVSLRRELSSRTMMIALPIALIWLRWRAYNPSRHRRSAQLPVLIATVSSIAAMFGCSAAGAWLEQQGYAPAGTTYWMPIAVFVVWGIATRRSAQDQPGAHGARTNAATA